MKSVFWEIKFEDKILATNLVEFTLNFYITWHIDKAIKLKQQILSCRISEPYLQCIEHKRDYLFLS